MTNEDRAFRGVWIPATIWLDVRLTATEKVILAEIDSRSRTWEGCAATNAELAKFAGCDVRTISRAIKHLSEIRLLRVHDDTLQRRLLPLYRMTVPPPPKDEKPTVDAVREYAREKGLTFDPERFIYYYEARGWKGIVDWKAAAMSWKGTKKAESDGCLKHEYTKEQLDSVVKKLEDLEDDWGD